MPGQIALQFDAIQAGVATDEGFASCGYAYSAPSMPGSKNQILIRWHGEDLQEIKAPRLETMLGENDNLKHNGASSGPDRVQAVCMSTSIVLSPTELSTSTAPKCASYTRLVSVRVPHQQRFHRTIDPRRGRQVFISFW